jgi:probable phosphoglycerate mutase
MRPRELSRGCSSESEIAFSIGFGHDVAMPSNATRIFMVRHGATVLSAEDRFAGATNVALSDEGRRQTQRLAERLASEDIAAVFASPLDRTIETARILAAPHRLEVQARAGLREISHGRWEQMTRREVERQFPHEAAEWEKDPYTFAPEGGESGLAVTARALPVLIEIVRAHPGRHVLVVSHKATIRLLLSSLLGFDPRRYRDNLDQKPAALNIVDFRDATRARLTLFNDTSHYDATGHAIPKVPESTLSKWWDTGGDGGERS